MFLLNKIIAWNINIIMNKKNDNNNIIIATRAYFQQIHVQISLPRDNMLYVMFLLCVLDVTLLLCM
jgi:hypothetical protein